MEKTILLHHMSSEELKEMIQQAIHEAVGAVLLDVRDRRMFF